MNFEFTPDQQMIGEQANNFLHKECTSEVVRRVLDTDAPYDKQLWTQISQLGWIGAAIPEEYGGLGLSYLELALIAEALGRAVTPVPFSSSVYLAAEFLLASGSEEQKQKWLPKIAVGEVIGTVALNGVATVDKTRGLQGTMNLVPDAQAADFCITAAQDGDSTVLCLVDLAEPAVEITPAVSIDPTRPSAAVSCSGASVELLGANSDRSKLIDDVLVRAAVLFAWEQVGGADAALQQARDYALERFAFGRPIASFQAIKHKLAQAYVKNTLARSNCYYAIWALNSNAPDLETAAAIARISATQAYYYVSKENIQTHGGMGFTWEFDCHLHYRRAKALSLVIGGESKWKKRLISNVLASG